MSQFTPEQEKEFEFRQRYEQEQAQQNQSTDNAKEVTAATNSVLYPAAGAVAAAAAGNLPSKIVNGMVKDPVTGKWMAVENYGRQMAQGKYYGGQNYDQVWDKIREYNADPTQGPRLEKEAMANRSTGQKVLSKVPKPLQGIVSAPMGVVGRSVMGLGAGMQGADAMNRYNEGDTSGAIISGIGALGTTAAMAPHPVPRIVGTAVGMGAEGLNMFLDKLKNKNKMAKGGLVDEEDGLSKAEKAALRIMKKKKKVKKLADGGSVGTTSLPANYQDARNAFDQQRAGQIGGPSAAVVGNDQFGQQFGYAADADAFNQFYNTNYGTSTPTPTAEYKTGLPPVTSATGDSSFSNTGGLGGLLSGNNPMASTTPPLSGPLSGVNSTPPPSPTAFGGGMAGSTQNLLNPQGAAQINPNVNFSNAMRPGAKPNVFNKFGTPLNQIRQSPGTAPQAGNIRPPVRRLPRLLKPR
jgi:hypothetical protein